MDTRAVAIGAVPFIAGSPSVTRPQNPVIESFIANYDNAFYAQLAEIAEYKCRHVLNEFGIPAIVTSRAKNRERLHDKLLSRNKTRETGPYQSEGDIKSDIADFVGVRIVLYFPEQEEELPALLADGVSDRQQQMSKVRLFKTGERGKAIYINKASPSEPEPEGYSATHLRVYLNDGFVVPGERRFHGTMIEIQIMSLLMHAWSEVNHDMDYKTLSGKLSVEERAALRSLNQGVRENAKLVTSIMEMSRARLEDTDRPLKTTLDLRAMITKYTYSPPHEHLGPLNLLLEIINQFGIRSRQFRSEIREWNVQVNPREDEHQFVQSMLHFLFYKNCIKDDPYNQPFLITKLNNQFQKQTRDMEDPISEKATQIETLNGILTYAFDEVFRIDQVIMDRRHTIKKKRAGEDDTLMKYWYSKDDWNSFEALKSRYFQAKPHNGRTEANVPQDTLETLKTDLNRMSDVWNIFNTTRNLQAALVFGRIKYGNEWGERYEASQALKWQMRPDRFAQEREEMASRIYKTPKNWS